MATRDVDLIVNGAIMTASTKQTPPRHAPNGDRPEVHRLTAFTREPTGGNPAGVVVTDAPLDDTSMLRIAAAVGYSEIAFLVPQDEPSGHRYAVRYFSPEAEVSFCGHATIASGVLLGERFGPATYVLDTGQGPVTVDVRHDGDQPIATLTSVLPSLEDVDEHLVEETLSALGWTPSVLDPDFTPVIAYAGARHLILVLASRATLADLDYDYERMRATMAARDLTTVALVYREHTTRYHARNLFPPGGVIEDPATGAAAAALGAYLRTHGHVTTPNTVEIEQGTDMGRPSHLTVHIPTGDIGIDVSGAAVAIPS
jgi:PhzF family phenazine biosynthesis protein